MEQHNQTGSAAQLATVKSLRNKSILWAAMVLVLMVVLVYLGVAWYTRISSTHSVTFDVADYDLAYNDNTKNEFLVNIYTYNFLKDKTVAPGTSGYIPLKISARHTEIDVEYTVVFENRIMPQLGDHIRVYYLVDKEGTPLVCDLDPTGTKPIEDHKAYFLATPTEANNTTYTKKYIDAATTGAAGRETITGTIQFDEGDGASKEKMIYFYWEWYADADAAYTAEALDTAPTDADKAAWDKVDTDIGRYAKKYEDAMLIHLKCSGVQSTVNAEQKQKQNQ